jgi:hypothetical protein
MCGVFISSIVSTGPIPALRYLSLGELDHQMPVSGELCSPSALMAFGSIIAIASVEETNRNLLSYDNCYRKAQKLFYFDYDLNIQ